MSLKQKADLHFLYAEIIRIRLAQIFFNERYKLGEFKIPIHLAMGHEALAVALSAAMEPGDQIVCTHRNVHYNLAREKSARRVLDEYLLKEHGLAKAELGSMNLANIENGVVYSSSILGNNMTFATGLALAFRVRRQASLVTVITGDGAIEEGAFYESLLFQKSNQLPCLTIIEDNEWSLGSKISERRCEIDTAKIADAFGVPFRALQGNDLEEYLRVIEEMREKALSKRTPVCLQVKLNTLGDWREVKPDFPEGKYINYHAGPTRAVCITKGPLIQKNDGDPVYLIEKKLGVAAFNEMVETVMRQVEEELR